MIGDHIRALRNGRWNHAIDCGDETVILLADDLAQAPARVRRSYRPEFVAGTAAVEVVTHRERTFPPEEVVARAYSRITDPALASMFRDSEAFAEWCVTGRLPVGTPVAAVPAPSPAAPAPVPARAGTAARSGTPAARKAPPRKTAPPRRKAKPGKATPPRRKAKPGRRARPARKAAGARSAKGPSRKKAPGRGGRPAKRRR
jgi:hypothetical protein